MGIVGVKLSDLPDMQCCQIPRTAIPFIILHWREEPRGGWGSGDSKSTDSCKQVISLTVLL